VLYEKERVHLKSKTSIAHSVQSLTDIKKLLPCWTIFTRLRWFLKQLLCLQPWDWSTGRWGASRLQLWIPSWLGSSAVVVLRWTSMYSWQLLFVAIMPKSSFGDFFSIIFEYLERVSARTWSPVATYLSACVLGGRRWLFACYSYPPQWIIIIFGRIERNTKFLPGFCACLIE